MKPKRFGEVALKLGYLNPEQLLDALNRQQQLRTAGQNKLIGLILLEMGMLDNFKLVNVLRQMEPAA